MDAALLADRPAARSVSGGSDKSRSGVTSPPSAAIRRPWMARAAAPASCWYEIARTRAAKCVSVGGSTWKGPAWATSLRKTGSRSDSISVAAS